jgi:hypothetical protein
VAKGVAVLRCLVRAVHEHAAGTELREVAP